MLTDYTFKRENLILTPVRTLQIFIFGVDSTLNDTYSWRCIRNVTKRNPIVADCMLLKETFIFLTTLT